VLCSSFYPSLFVLLRDLVNINNVFCHLKKNNLSCDIDGLKLFFNNFNFEKFLSTNTTVTDML
jgi:hypothetical protein